MKLFGPLTRVVAIAGLLVAALAAVPAAAAPADIALLSTYLGSWKGRGQLIGAERETVVCTMKLSKGNQDKVNYSGRCAMAGTNISVAGTLAYIDAKRRYEAAMTSNVGFTGTAIGQKQGNGVVFNLRERGDDGEGNDVTVAANISLLNGKIAVDFNVVFNATGESLRATIPFAK